MGAARAALHDRRVLRVTDISRQGFWGKDVDSPADVFIQMANRARENDQNRRLMMVELLCLYSNQPWDEYGAAEKPLGAFERMSQNHVENMVHTVHAETVQNRTRMTVVTSGGDYRMKTRAKELDKFSEGQAYEDDQENVGTEAKLDALVWGTGIEKTYVDSATNRVAGDRLIGWHLHADRAEAARGLKAVRTFYEDGVFDREVLKAAYNSKETDEAIDNAPRTPIDDYPYTIDSDSNLILVQEGFHLPSRPIDARAPGMSEDEQKADDKKGANDKSKSWSGDGRHMIVVPGQGGKGSNGKRGGLLFSEPWKKGSFPYHFLYWLRPRFGLWGKGLVEQLLGQQWEHNRLSRYIQLSMKRAGNLKVLIDGASGVIKTHINDKIGTIVTYNSQGGGHKPEWVVHDTVSPQIINYKAQLGQEMYATAGVSQMSSQGILPQGMDKASGRAIRTADSISSKRRLPFLKDCEQFDRKVAEAKIELAQEVAAKEGSYAVAYHGRRTIELVDWKNVNLKRDQWFMRVYPTSALPTEPSARIATLDEWLQATLIDKPTYKRLADFPDLEDAETLDSASWDLGEKIIDGILYKAEPFTPEPLLDNKLWAQMGLKEYNRAKKEGIYPEKNMEMLREFVLACIDASKPPPQPAAPPGMPTDGMAPPEGMPPMPPEGAPPMPPGAPGMPPVNQAGPPPGLPS